MIFKGFNYSKQLLDWSQYFKKLKGKEISTMLPKSWKKSFKNGVLLPIKTRGCNDCKNNILCITCNNQTDENKELEPYLNLLKRHASNRFANIFFLIIKNRMILFVRFYLIFSHF